MSTTKIHRVSVTEFEKLLDLLDFPYATTIIYVEKRYPNGGFGGPRRTLVDYGMPSEWDIDAKFWERLEDVAAVIVKERVKK